MFFFYELFLHKMDGWGGGVLGDVGGSRIPNFSVKFSWPFFVLKTSRNAMKSVINEGGGHIWSFLDAMTPFKDGWEFSGYGQFQDFRVGVESPCWGSFP